MTNSQRLATIRKTIEQWIRASNEPADTDVDARITRESVLIRDEFFVGRRFYLPSHRAVWFIEEDELKISDLNGKVLCVMRGSEIDEGIADELDPRPAPEILSDQIQAEEDGTGEPLQAGSQQQDEPAVLEFPSGKTQPAADSDQYRRAA